MWPNKARQPSRAKKTRGRLSLVIQQMTPIGNIGVGSWAAALGRSDCLGGGSRQHYSYWLAYTTKGLPVNSRMNMSAAAKIVAASGVSRARLKPG